MDIDDQIAIVAKINAATKDIPDEETRTLAFKSLLAQAGLNKSFPAGNDKPNNSVQETIQTEAAPTKRKRGKAGSPKGAPDIDPDLNLEPENKLTFGDFVKKRNLKSHIDKICGAIYYLSDVLKLDKVGLAQIATCYKDQDWDWPADFKNKISQGKTAKRVVYDSMEEIRLTATETNAMKKEIVQVDA